MIIFLMAILLKVIGDYFLNDFSINKYFINGYWWLFS
jgi:hypothetical protein